MVVCPFDCHWCDAASCRFAGCELTAEPPLAPCADCGALVTVPATLDICIECIALVVPARTEA
ncbi:MAG: hypothetical protein M3R31_13340 [Pseudomonadota bacterium]|nr:hypothetical protein [Pseudomonadota bacterium]